MSHLLLFGWDDLLTPSWDEKRQEVLEREKKEHAARELERFKARCDIYPFWRCAILTLL